MTVREVELLSEEGAKEILIKMIEHLDELDDNEFFGREGWRASFKLEEE